MMCCCYSAYPVDFASSTKKVSSLEQLIQGTKKTL